MLANAQSRPGFVSSRRQLLDARLREAGITDERVIGAIQAVPRELFAAAHALDQIVLDPCIAGVLVQALHPKPTDHILVIGDTTGYLAAILSLLVAQVFSLDDDRARADAARERLAAFGYARIVVGVAHGGLGWPYHAPYEGVVICDPHVAVTPQLRAQLAQAGRLVTATGAL